MIQPCLLIPVFDHKDTIADVVDSLEYLDLPCLVVNDGSDGDTRRVLDGIARTKNWVRLMHFSKNRGKGAAVMAGIHAAFRHGYTHAVQIDADGQHNARDVPVFLKEAERYPDALILGKPIFNAQVPRMRILGRMVSRFWVWVETLSFAIADPLFGFRVYPVLQTERVTREYTLGTCMDFDPEIAVRLYWEGTPVRNIRTAVRYPEDGLSHFRMLRDNARISWSHARLLLGMLLRARRLLAMRGNR